MKLPETQQSRLLLLVVIVLLLTFISVFVNVVFGREIVYTHLFYLPIILAGLWYYRRALYVAAFLGVFHIVINYLEVGVFVPSTLYRTLIFCVMAWAIGSLAENKDKLLLSLDQARQEKGLILQNLAEMVVYQDREQRIIWANPAAERNYGRNSDELAGQKCYEAWHLRSSPCVDCPVTRSLTTGQVEKSEVTTPDGRFWIITGSPVRDGRGKITGAVETALDITGRREAEKALQQLNLELEQRVEERTNELEVINNELDAFTYSVSHDLRAPLRSIEGFSQALLEDYGELLDDQGKDYLNRVSAAGKRMSELIDDLLKLSRVTRLEMCRDEVNLSSLANICAQVLASQDEKRQVEMVIQPGVVVYGDYSLLRIAVENLLGNAWKFTQKEAQARIEFGTVDQDGQTVYLISDNGAGFDMAYAGKLFKPFQRLHDEDDYTGTGIGLSIVNRIIQRHGGKIWARGEVDRGATFFFTLGMPQ